MTLPGFEARRLSFGTDASAYADFRPDYPAAAVDWVLAAVTGDVVTVADVGAGTGALTQVIANKGLVASAYDADEDMLAELSRRLPEVPTHVSSANSLPLSSSSVDALFAAQAWHWFSQPATSQEFLRVVRPGGTIGLLWNNRDATVPWLADLADLVDGTDAGISSSVQTLENIAALHPSVEQRVFEHMVSMSPVQVIGLVSTLSNVNRRSDAAQVYSAVRDLLQTHPDTVDRDEVEMRYVTVTYRIPVS